MDDVGSSDDAGVGPQALDILAGLASLGISPSLREQVQQALADLTQAAGVVANPQLLGNPEPILGNQAAVPASTPAGSSSRENALQRKVEELEQKMAMSRSIMKKLYHRNVELEKELAIAIANQAGVDLTASLPPGTPGAPAGLASSRVQPALRPSTSPSQCPEGCATDASPSSLAMQERDLTIRQLQHALEAARRRCALLEMQLGNGAAAAGAGGAVAGRGVGGSSGPGRGLGGGGGGGFKVGGGISPDSLRDLLEQSALHHQKYKQIREDYNRLLCKRGAALQAGSRSSTSSTSSTSAAAAAVAARALVGDLQRRLADEVQEREAEAALYSARLYESEKAMSDWYVEKRLLEEHISRLSAEVAERDNIDGEIEGCVTQLLERLRAVEGENEALRAQLTGAGGPGGG